MLSVAQSIPETLQSVLNPYLMAINFHSIGRARLILSVNRLSTRTARTELYGWQINCTSLPFLSLFLSRFDFRLRPYTGSRWLYYVPYRLHTLDIGFCFCF